MTYLARCFLFAGLSALPSVAVADDGALVRGIIGGVFQTLLQQAQKGSEQQNGTHPFRVQDEAAERQYFRQEIQRRLNLLGYDAGNPDGRFGPRTRSAIAAFQSGIGHPTTGKITQNEVAILYEKTNGGQIGISRQENANVIQPTITPSTNVESPAEDSITLTPVAQLKPAVPASSVNSVGEDFEPADSVKENDGDTISIQPSIPLPSGN